MFAKITLVLECPSRKLGGVCTVFFRFLEEIHVGELDWQSNHESVTALTKLMDWDVTVVTGAGHMLLKEYVGAMLEGWFTQKNQNISRST